MICISDSLSRICKGKRVKKNTFSYPSNLNDTQSALFVSRNEEKSVCVFILIENGVALWFSGYCIILCCLLIFCRPVFRHLFSIVFYKV